MSTPRRPLGPALLALALVLGAGCATTDAQRKAEEERPLWPLPPEPTRIRFEESLRSEEDVQAETGFWAGVAAFFTGEEPGVALKKPYAAVADAEGRVFVTDTGLGRVAVFDPEAHEVRLWGGAGAATLERPTGITVDAEGNLYVADAAQRRVVRLHPDGRYDRAYGRAGELARPAGLAVNDDRGLLYVADTGGHRVAVFDVETTKKRFDIGKRGGADGEFNFPTNLALDRVGNVYVMDTFNFRVQVFGPDGAFHSKFGQNCDMPGCFSRSKGIAVDSEGHVYVADAAFNVVQIFDREGRLLLTFGGAGHGPGQLWLPAGLSIDAKDRIYVADQYNFRINVYQYVSQAEEDGASPAKVREVDPAATTAEARP